MEAAKQGTVEVVKKSDPARRERAVSMEFVEMNLRDAQKMGQSRLRSFLASLGTVPIFGPGLGFSPAPLSPNSCLFPATHSRRREPTGLRKLIISKYSYYVGVASSRTGLYSYHSVVVAWLDEDRRFEELTWVIRSSRRTRIFY